MANFKDSNGRMWTVALDAPTIRTVRTECDGLDLADLEGKAFAKLVDDPVLLVDALWVICRKQANAQGITDEMFGAALVGDSIESATTAMLESIADFFPKSKGALVKTMAERNQTMRQEGMKRALAKINDPALEQKVLAAMDEAIDAELQSLLTRLNSATNTRGSSASRPMAAVSAN